MRESKAIVTHAVALCASSQWDAAAEEAGEPGFYAGSAKAIVSGTHFEIKTATMRGAERAKGEALRKLGEAIISAFPASYGAPPP